MHNVVDQPGNIMRNPNSVYSHRVRMMADRRRSIRYLVTGTSPLPCPNFIYVVWWAGHLDLSSGKLTCCMAVLHKKYSDIAGHFL